MLSTAGTAVLGLAFWALAARTYPAGTVGAASAAVSAASLVAVAAQLNLTAVYTRFLPLAGTYAVRFVARGYLATVALAGTGSAAFAWSGAADAYLGTSVAARVSFVLLAVLLMLSAVQDAVLTGLRRAGTVLVENLAFAAGKVVLLGACAAFAVPAGIMIGWLVPLAVAVLAVSGGLFGVWLPRHARAASASSASPAGPSGSGLPDRRRLASFVAAEYVKSLLTVLAPTVIPLLVVAELGARENAYLSVPWMINAAVVSLFYNVSAAFVVESAHGAPLHSGSVRRLLGLIGAVAAAGLVVGAVLPGTLLGLLGADYAQNGADLFRRLALALPLEAVTAVYATFVWIERRLWRLVLLQAVNTTVLLAGTVALLPSQGVLAVGSAYLASQLLLGLGSLRPAWRRLRSAVVVDGADGSLAQVAQTPGGDARVQAPRGAVPGDDGTGCDHAVLADGDPGEDHRACPHPDMVGEGDRTRVPDGAPAALAVEVVPARDDEHLHAQGAVASDPDRGHRLQVTVRVDEAPRTDADVAGLPLEDAAVHDPRGLHPQPGQAVQGVAQDPGGQARRGDPVDQEVPQSPGQVQADRGGSPPDEPAERPGTDADTALTVGHEEHGGGSPSTDQPTTPSGGPVRQAVPAVLVAAGAMSVAALALWLVALPDVDLARMDGRGLLACLPPGWFAALALAVMAPCLLLGVRPVRTPAVFASLAVLVGILYGTTSAIYLEPRSYSTYKHVAVVEYFLAGHPIERGLDIYQNWPGFFLSAAAVHLLSGVPVLALARWAEPFFALLVTSAVSWAVGGLAPREADDPEGAQRWRAVRWTAALLVTVANWVGQNYFSPQAFAFPLSLLVVGMLLRMIPRPFSDAVRWRFDGWRLRRAARTVLDGPGESAGFWGSRAGAVVCLLTYAVVVVSHQLSPVIVLGQAIALLLVFRLRNAWLPLAFAVAEVAWLAQSWGYIGRRFSLLQVDGVRNVRPPSARPVDTLPWAQTLTWASPLLMAMLGLLTLVAVLRLAEHLTRRPERRWMLAPVLFGLVPIAVVAVQPYGNEGIFRAFLFALPWSAVLVARGLLVYPVHWRPGRGWLRFAVPALLAGLWLPTSFAPELTNYVYPSDVRAAVWAAGHVPANAGYLRVTDGTPMPLTGDYAGHRSQWELLNQPLTVWPGFGEAVAGGGRSLASYAARSASWYPVPDVYLFLGPGQAAHVRYFGDLGPTTWPELEAAIASGGEFELVHREGDSTIWRYLRK